MPIVPTFNGGSPSVHESVSSAPQAQAYIPSTQNYERLMNTAMKTVNDGVNTIEKAMEVADARYVKAQSDDAESQVMQAINTALYDKDNGYFTKQGKNAIDSFKDTADGLKKTVDEIIGKQDPRVKEALRSRVDQRMLSAGTSMQRWYTGQAQQYNVKSSSDRITSLMNDGAQNYANNDYWGKTMAAIDNELAYIGKLQGLSDDTLKAERSRVWDASMALRFQTWSDDDPEGALKQFFVDADSLDHKTKRQLSTSLQARYASECFSSLIGTRAFKEMNPNIKTGLAFDDCDESTRRTMLSRAHAQTIQHNQSAKVEIGKDLKNKLSEASATGVFTPYSEEDFLAFGENASDACDQANAQLRHAADLYNIPRMPLAGSLEYAEQQKPVSGSKNYYEQDKRYKEIQKVISETASAFKKDGIGKALQVGVFGYQPLTGDIRNDKEELKYRVMSSTEFQNQYGLENPVIFSNAEMDAFICNLAKQESFTAQSAILREYADVLGDKGIQVLSSQLRAKNAVYAIAMAKVNDSIDGENGPSVGMKVLEGNYYLNTNKKVSLEKGAEKEILNKFGTVDDPTAVFPNQKALDAEVEAAKCMYAYELARGRSINAEDAVRKSVGEIDEINGKKVILSEGMDSSDTLDYVKGYLGALTTRIGIYGVSTRQMSFTKEEVLENIQNIQLETYDKSNGKASYMIRTSAGYLANKDGTPMIIEVPTMAQLNAKTKAKENVNVDDSFDYGYGSAID